MIHTFWVNAGGGVFKLVLSSSEMEPLYIDSNNSNKTIY